MRGLPDFPSVAPDDLDGRPNNQSHRGAAEENGPRDHCGEGRRHGVVETHERLADSIVQQDIITECREYDHFRCERVATCGGGDEAATLLLLFRCGWMLLDVLKHFAKM